MEPRVISVNERTEMGTGAVRRIRREGAVPAVVYAEGHPAKHITLNAHEYQLAVRGVKPAQIFKFKSSSSALDGTMTLIKAVQMEPIKGQVLHVDFISISAGHRLTVTVPVELTGESAAIKENRAFLNQTVYEIDVECLPDAIPSSLKLDITTLNEGGTLHASDVQLPEGVRLRSLPKLTIVSAISKKALEAQEAAAEAAAQAAKQAGAATAAAAPAAEGAGAAAGKDDKKGK
ncbi:MAG: 50S ribosomal protein L25 [Bdellovibrionota bacterium]